MSERYTETIVGHTLSCAISPGDGTIHDSRKGWGTYSSDGRSITWDTWRPPTPEEIAKAKAHVDWFKSPEGQQRLREGEAEVDKLYARFGTSRAKVAEVISKVIQDAPPMRFTP